MVTSPRASAFTGQQTLVPVDHPFEVEHRRMLAETTDQALEGKIRSVDSVTLTESSATTILNDRRIGPSSFIGFEPETANAKTEGTPYVTARGDGTATLNHANNAQTDRTYTYVVLG